MTRGLSAETPGQWLRATRLARGCDLETAHEGTKIPPRLLEALERDEYHQVSDMLYVRSFLRSYAAWLELDTEQVLKLYEQVAGDPGSSPDTSAPVWSEDQVMVRRIGIRLPRYLLLSLAGLGVLLILSLVWFFWLRGIGDASLPVQELPVVPAPLSEEAAMAAPAIDATAPIPASGDADVLELPTAVRGDPRLRFVGGAMFDLVLRIRLPEGAHCMVKRDGQPGAMPLIWPEDQTPLPAANLRHGLAYAVRDGHVAYWGTSDNFEVTLGDLQGVEVRINGVPQEVDRWRPGQPFMLDMSNLHADGDGH